MPLLASAQPTVIEFLVPNDFGAGVDLTYQVVLHETDKQKDEIRRADQRRIFETVFVGPVTSIEVPADARVTVARGLRGDVGDFLTWGEFRSKRRYAASLRVRSNESLVVVTDFGAAAVPWPGKVWDVRQLDVELDMYTGASVVIFSVKGQSSSNTYMVVNDDFKSPHKILEKFSTDPLGVSLSDGIIYIESLKREFDPEQLAKAAQWLSSRPPRGSVVPSIYAPELVHGRKTLAEIFPAPEGEETLNELIAQLNDREPLFSSPDSQDLAKKAVRAVIVRDFPRVLSLSKEDPKVRDALIIAVEALTQLWLSRRIEDGDKLRQIVLTRLEAGIQNRAKCELALMSIKGQGAHNDGYFRGKALRALNTLYRRLYRK